MLLALASVTIRRCNPYGTGLLALYFLLLACTPLAGEATIVPSNATEAISKSMLYLLFATALMAPLVIGDRPGPLGRLCSSGPMVWLGEISYEMFLCTSSSWNSSSTCSATGRSKAPRSAYSSSPARSPVPIAWALHRTLERVIPSGPRVERRPMTVVRRGADRVPTTSPVD